MKCQHAQFPSFRLVFRQHSLLVLPWGVEGWGSQLLVPYLHSGWHMCQCWLHCSHLRHLHNCVQAGEEGGTEKGLSWALQHTLHGLGRERRWWLRWKDIALLCATYYNVTYMGYCRWTGFTRILQVAAQGYAWLEAFVVNVMENPNLYSFTNPSCSPGWTCACYRLEHFQLC